MTNHEDEDRRGRPLARHTNEALRAVIDCPERDALIQAREELAEVGLKLSDVGELILSANEQLDVLKRQLREAAGAISATEIDRQVAQAKRELESRKGGDK